MNAATLVYVTVVVRDYDEAIAFYTQKMGFTLVSDQVLTPEKRWVLVGPAGQQGCCLLLAKAANAAQEAAIGNQTGGRVFLFLGVQNFWAHYEAWRAQGLEMVRPPRQEAYGWVAVFADLYGNNWDLVEYPPRL